MPSKEGHRNEIKFGVNVNNREPLIAPEYNLEMLLDLAAHVEELGFDSVWVGDSLFSKPRYEPIVLLSAISQRTSRVRLGTSCMVSSTRNPLYLALEWATLDRISGGRTILGTGIGNPEEGVKREFAALGLDFKRRGTIFEEGLKTLRSLWTDGTVNLDGDFYSYEDISFYSGTELGPLMPIQTPPPIWVVSNPWLVRSSPPDDSDARLNRVCRRVIEYGDGWMTCCRAAHPDELTQQIGYLERWAEAREKDFSRYPVAYQVTMNIGDSEKEAHASLGEYLAKYYPELSKATDVSDWGPVGTPDQISSWLSEFARRGVTHFVCRFGSIDQFGQVERFAREILPAFQTEREEVTR